MRMPRRFLLLPILLAAVAPLHAQGGEAAVLQPGDAIQLTVWRSEEFSGEYLIADDGTIMHPLLRDVRVTGVSLATMEGRIRDRLEGLMTSPQFVAQPLLRVSVGGEVRQPSLYRLPPGTSIAEAVALAGGATERGRLERVRLLRGGEQLRVDLVSPQAGLAQQPIRSGDQIYVEVRRSLFREYIAPAGSITAALVSLISVLTR